jgi:glyoxylase-like metal-dependent hydrolase (beta-lactamase superfamily II)
MRVHHLNCGTMRPFGGKLVDGNPGYLRRATMVCHCLLIETENGLVLVDSGLGADDMTNPNGSLPKLFQQITHPTYDIEETAKHQVVRLGYKPEDVQHIVLTHLDLDHAGGLRDFPQAKVHVYNEELRNATARTTRQDRARFRPTQWSHNPTWQTYDPKGAPWYGFNAVRELKGLPEKILLIPLAGHTLGHAGVAIQTNNKWLLHCGDAYFNHGETRDAANCPTGLRLFQRIMETDNKARRSNQDRLRTLLADHGDEVETISAHDPVELHRYAPQPTH